MEHRGAPSYMHWVTDSGHGILSNVGKQWKVGAALIAAGILLPATIAFAAPSLSPSRPPAVAFSFDRSFTPAQADPRLAAALSSRPIAAAEFKFTPTAARKRAAQVRVAIRAQADGPQSLTSRSLDTRTLAAGSLATALTPATYNLGAAVGWRRFAVDGDVAQVKPNALGLGGREGALVGVNYSIARRLTGRVAASADRSNNRVPALPDTSAYAVDVGGAYDINRSLSVTGGVRYRIERERIAAAAADQRRDSQAVYLGTAIKF